MTILIALKLALRIKPAGHQVWRPYV